MPSLSGAAKGAATGAGIGSFVPGVGTAVGAGIGGLIGLFKGGKKKKKPGEMTDGTPSVESALQTAANKKGAQGDQMLSQGADATNPAMQYYKSLIGQDPSALLDSTRGARGLVIDQYDSARRAAANFGPRGGGTNAAIGESRNMQANQLGDILAAGKSEAAGKLGELGTTMTGLGLTSQQLQSQDLNSLLSAILTREGFDIEKRGQTMAAVSSGLEAVGTLLGTYLTRNKAA